MFSRSKSSASLVGAWSLVTRATLRVLSTHALPSAGLESTGEAQWKHQHPASASPKDAAEKTDGLGCLGLGHAAGIHLLVDSELTRKSCLVFLCFLRMTFTYLNPLSDLSVIRPAKPCFLLLPQPPGQTVIHRQPEGSCKNLSQVMSLLGSEPSHGSLLAQGQSQVLLVAYQASVFLVFPPLLCLLLLHLSRTLHRPPPNPFASGPLHLLPSCFLHCNTSYQRGHP